MREIEVPVKPHVKKMLISEYGPEPILASQSNVLGFIVSSQTANHRKSTYENRAKYNEFLKITLPYRVVHKNCISKKKIAMISCHLESIFRMLFISHIKSQMCMNVNLYDSIRSFLKRYSIEEEELSFDAAEAIYKRYSRKEEKKIKAYKILPAHPSC